MPAASALRISSKHRREKEEERLASKWHVATVPYVACHDSTLAFLWSTIMSFLQYSCVEFRAVGLDSAGAYTTLSWPCFCSMVSSTGEVFAFSDSIQYKTRSFHSSNILQPEMVMDPTSAFNGWLTSNEHVVEAPSRPTRAPAGISPGRSSSASARWPNKTCSRRLR